MAASRYRQCIQTDAAFTVEAQKAVRTMLERKLTIAEILLIAATRVALGVGIGLLLSRRLNSDQRKAAGIALTLFGGLTTIPLALNIAIEKAGTGFRSAA